MSNVAIFRNVFNTAGLAPHTIDGIIANFIWESGGNTDIATGQQAGDSGNAWGAASWAGQRRQNLLAAAAALGKPWSDPEVQALFTLHEGGVREIPGVAGFGSERAAFQALAAARDAQEATQVFSDRYERPGTPHMDGRMNALQYAGGGSTGHAMAYAPTQSPTGAQAAAAGLAGGTGSGVASPSQPQMQFPILDRIKARMGDRPTPFLDRLRGRLTDFRERRMERWGAQPQQQAPAAPPPQSQFSTASQLRPGGTWEAGTMPGTGPAAAPPSPTATPAGPASLPRGVAGPGGAYNFGPPRPAQDQNAITLNQQMPGQNALGFGDAQKAAAFSAMMGGQSRPALPAKSPLVGQIGQQDQVKQFLRNAFGIG